jgi:hypothetical protein
MIFATVRDGAGRKLAPTERDRVLAPADLDRVTSAGSPTSGGTSSGGGTSGGTK